MNGMREVNRPMSTNNPSPTLDAEDLALLEEARVSSESEDAAALAAAAAADGAPAPQAAAAPVAAAPVPAAPAAAPAAPAAAPAAAATPAPPAPAAPAAAPAADAGGNVKAALRASRINEQRLAERLREQNAEIERLRQAAAAAAPAPASAVAVPDTVLKDLETYAPEAAAALKAAKDLEDENRRLKAGGKPAATDEEPFVPEVLPPAIQAAVRANEDLFEWQMNPDQRLYVAAGDMNRYLITLPRWAKASVEERFAEVVRRVKADAADAASLEASAAPAPATLADAAAVIASAPAAPRPAGAPLTAGDMRGGMQTLPSEIPDYHAMVRSGVSDEDIIASLPPG